MQPNIFDQENRLAQLSGIPSLLFNRNNEIHPNMPWPTKNLSSTLVDAMLAIASIRRKRLVVLTKQSSVLSFVPTCAERAGKTMVSLSAQLEKLGDPLLRLESIVDWNAFKPLLKKIHQRKRNQYRQKGAWIAA